MAGRLTGKVAIVTGASRGVGRATALALGAEGATVVLAGRDASALAETAKRAGRAGFKTRIIAGDLTREEDARRLIGDTLDALGTFDILVNNAGITHSAAVEATDTIAFDRCMAVNARAPFILCREALPILKTRPEAFIVNIASVVAVKGYSGQSAYTASKHALRGFSIALAEELRGTNVRVHVLCPGGIDTEMVGRVRPDIARAALIRPGEIAELIIYLVTRRGIGVIDEVRIRRAPADPWF